MNGSLSIFNILQNDVTYAALIGKDAKGDIKIYYDEAQETVPLPFSIIQTDSIDPNDTKDGASTLDNDMVYVTHFAATKKAVAAISVAARAALERKNGTFGGIVTIGLQFKTQRSDTERLIDKKVFTEEQLYQVMTTQ